MLGDLEQEAGRVVRRALASMVSLTVSLTNRRQWYHSSGYGMGGSETFISHRATLGELPRSLRACAATSIQLRCCWRITIALDWPFERFAVKKSCKLELFGSLEVAWIFIHHTE